MTDEMIINVSFWADMCLRLAVILVIGSVTLSFIALLERKDGRKRPRGLVIFCTLLILGSIYKLWGFWNYDYYRFMFQQLSEQAIFIRYCGSVILRLVSLVIAAGVLLLKDSFRKALIGFCLFTLCLLYFKHPYFVFENIARYTEQLFLNKIIVTELEHPAYPWISLVFNYVVDIVFSGSMLYYFTRQNIKRQFS